MLNIKTSTTKNFDFDWMSGKDHTTSLSIRTPPKFLNLLISSWLKNFDVLEPSKAGFSRASIK